MLAKLEAFIRERGVERTYWVALSGGLDSQVLLQLCVRLRKTLPFSLRAIHIHHGISQKADLWAAHCAASCEKEQVEFFCERVLAKPPQGESLEAYAREKRYAVFEKLLGPGDFLLTAHHQDDQAETVLLQLFRGAGPKGLSAMPLVKSLGKGLQARPLLSFTRAELQVFAEAENLQWVEDELNQDSQYSRNFIRHEVLPLIKKHWPMATKTVARSAENCAEVQTLLDNFADEMLLKVQGEKPGTLSVKGLVAVSPARQRLILRRWFELQGILLPSAIKMNHIQRDVLHACEDRNPCVSWGEVALRRYRDELYVTLPLKPHHAARVYTWDFTAPLILEGVGQLQATSELGQGLRSDLKQVEVRFRRGGETFLHPDGRHRELKKFFQETSIPPWLRDRLPLLYVKEELIAIPGYLLVETFKAKQNEKGLAICLA